VKLEVCGIGKRFYDPQRGEFMACENISFNVAPGEVYGLLGSNGAGKTTTLRVLATIYKPTFGQAHLGKIDIVKNPQAARSRIGYLSSSMGLYERLTAKELLFYFGELYGMSRTDLPARINTIAETLGFTQYLNVRAGKLSQGTRQKVSIARSIIHDPQLLILDEPATGLDVLATAAMHDFILAERALGKSVVLSTHIMSEAQKLCDRIGIIDEGKLLAQGSLAELRLSTSVDGGLEEIFIATVKGRKLE
jgi:sodium transport system ATP-binding protein